MKKIFYFIRVKETNEKHAGNKAVSDSNAILEKAGGQPLYIASVESENKWISKFEKFFQYMDLFKIPKNSIVYVQHPMYINPRYMNWISYLKKIKKVKVIFIVHDLESLRKLFVNEAEKYEILDNSMAKLGDVFIAHNMHMIDYMKRRWNISDDKIVNLEIFDYLLEKDIEHETLKNNEGIIIAGNLSKQKSGYIYRLNLQNINLNVYGNGLDTGVPLSNINYKGSFSPNELPYNLYGKFGLVWDGPETDTCAGTVGSYLRYNNPHKVSLYLAAGIPVIIWSEAALASFVEDNKVGIVIDSLENIEQVVRRIDEKEYIEMKTNALEISKRLGSGFYLSKAIQAANNREI